mmetsp:Transcript_40608/g.132651  ORF Transcript_40608/g.132651 Transcript_40608/m.132651 type:complete len:250 (+) Transcript_40608:89-838(+)
MRGSALTCARVLPATHTQTEGNNEANRLKKLPSRCSTLLSRPVGKCRSFHALHCPARAFPRQRGAAPCIHVARPTATRSPRPMVRRHARATSPASSRCRPRPSRTLASRRGASQRCCAREREGRASRIPTRAPLSRLPTPIFDRRRACGSGAPRTERREMAAPTKPRRRSRPRRLEERRWHTSRPALCHPPPAAGPTANRRGHERRTARGGRGVYSERPRRAEELAVVCRTSGGLSFRRGAAGAEECRL